MILGVRNNTLAMGFTALIVFSSVSFWSFRLIPDFTYNAIEAIIIFILFLIVFSRSGVFTRRELHFRSYAFLFLLAPLPSVVGASLYHNQPIAHSLYMSRSSLLWLLYFALHIFNLSRAQLTKLTIFTGATWAFLTIIQQFTYPVYYFYSRDDEKKSIYRAGVYRFMLAGKQYGTFMLLYFFYKYLNNRKLWYLAGTVFGLIGFYYYGTRQTALAVVACMCFSVWYLQGQAKWRNLVLLAGLGLVLLGLKEILFSEYIEMTNRQLEYDDDIRMLSGRFYLLEYWPDSPWAKLLGNGKPYPESAYSNELLVINTGLRYFRSDVGIIGAYNTYGLFYVILVVSFIIKGMTMQFTDAYNRYLRLFYVNALILLIINESFSSGGTIPFFCIVMYLMDKAKAEERIAAAADIPEEEETYSNTYPEPELVSRY